jgi:hypothetical protein
MKKELMLGFLALASGLDSCLACDYLSKFFSPPAGQNTPSNQEILEKIDKNSHELPGDLKKQIIQKVESGEKSKTSAHVYFGGLVKLSKLDDLARDTREIYIKISDIPL